MSESYITEYSTDKIEMHTGAVHPGQRVLLVSGTNRVWQTVTVMAVVVAESGFSWTRHRAAVARSRHVHSNTVKCSLTLTLADSVGNDYTICCCRLMTLLRLVGLSEPASTSYVSLPLQERKLVSDSKAMLCHAGCCCTRQQACMHMRLSQLCGSSCMGAPLQPHGPGHWARCMLPAA